MRSHECYYPACLRYLFDAAGEFPGLDWRLKAALAMNRDTESDCPEGPLWEYSVGWAASQCLKASFVLELDELPDEFQQIVHHLLLQLDLNRGIQVAEWSNPRKAFELAATHGYAVAATRLRDGKKAQTLSHGVLPKLFCRAGVVARLEPVIEQGDVALQIVLGTHSTSTEFSPDERAILLSSVGLFGPNHRLNREQMWKVLSAPQEKVGQLAQVVALVKLAAWFNLADVGEVARIDRQRLQTVSIADPSLQRLIAVVPQFVKDEVLAA